MTTATRTFAKDDLVTLDYLFERPGEAGKIWKITKVPAASNQVNYTLEPVTGGRGLKAKAYMLVPATDAQRAVAEAQINAEPVLRLLDVGEVVTVTGMPQIDSEQRHVVLGYANDRVKIAKLGGDNGRYWKIGRRCLHVVDV